MVSVYSSDAGGYIDAESASTSDMLTVTFDTPITDTVVGGADTLYVSFDTNLMRSYHTFDAYLTNSGQNDGAGGIMVWTNDEQGSSTVFSNTAVQDIEEPAVFEPPVAYPNPFNASTSISVSVMQTGNMRGEIYSITGQKVRTLFDRTMTPGRHTVVWDSRDAAGAVSSSGIYIFRLTSKSVTSSCLVTLIK